MIDGLRTRLHGSDVHFIGHHALRVEYQPKMVSAELKISGLTCPDVDVLNCRINT
jgi:hypothetical protein